MSMTSSNSRFSTSPPVPPFQYAAGAALSINRTIRAQGEVWLANLASRQSAPLQPSTLNRWAGALRNWIYPVLGDLPLSEVHNATLRFLVQRMAEAGLSTSTIQTYVRIIQMVVASFTDSDGEQLYPRRWNPTLFDLPRIHHGDLNAPCFSADTVSGIVQWEGSPCERMLFVVAATSEARISELLGLEIDKHISPDCATLRVKTLNSEREVDLHSAVADLLQRYIVGRTSGLLFSTPSGKPLHLASILKFHLHPALQSLGYINPVTGKCMAGTHAFRRYRNAYLGQCEGLPERLHRYWMGHSYGSMTCHYDKVHLERAFRKAWAERCGFGFDLPRDASPDSHDLDTWT